MMLVYVSDRCDVQHTTALDAAAAGFTKMEESACQRCCQTEQVCKETLYPNRNADSVLDSSLGT